MKPFYIELKRKVAKHLLKSMVDLPKVRDLDALFLAYGKDSLDGNDALSLDLGCGRNPRNPFNAKELKGVDVFEDNAMSIRKADLASESIPYSGGTFDYVTAFDFLEHVPRIIYLPDRRLPFVELMNEVWRVLKPNGIFFSYTPIYPFSPVFRDPTHVNVLTEETFPFYFDDNHRWAEMYGFLGSFTVLAQYLQGDNLVSFLQKAELTIVHE